MVHSSLLRITQAKMIASAGSGLIAIFIPLLLLDKGLELHQVCLFYFAYSSSKIITDIASFAILHKYGSGLALTWGYLLGFVFSVMLSFYVSGIAPSLLYVMPVFMAFQNSLLWSASHLHIATQMDTSRKSRDLATMANASRAAAVATPFIGGLVAATFGAATLAALAATVSAAAVLPIWPIRNKVDDMKAEKMTLSLRHAPLRDLVGNFGFNIHASVGVYVWPIYLAVFIPNFRSIGLVTALSAGFGVIVLQLVGRRGDRGKSFRVLAEGTGASSLVHIGRMAASSNPITITVVSALYDLALDYQSNAWTSLYYAHTRQRGLHYIVSMEIIGSIAKSILFLVLSIVSFYKPDDSFFSFAFIGAACIAWLCLGMSKEQNKEKFKF